MVMFRVVARARARSLRVMRGAWSTLLTVTVLVVTVSVTAHEHEASDALAQLKERLLSGLGMERMPDMRLVNTSAEHLQRMTRRYFRKLRESERELVTYHPTDSKDNFLLFKPDVERSNGIQTAKLLFPNSTTMDISSSVRNWKIDSNHIFSVECREQQCKKAKLQILVRRSRSTRSQRRRSRFRCKAGCCQYSLKVNFKDIGWNWVVQPEEFEAYYCKGRCNNKDTNFGSTHAIIQNIMVNNGQTESGRPCCAPRKMKYLDLLYYNNEVPPELTVARQKGMIARECACI